MEVRKLIAPEFRVTVGSYEIKGGIGVECFSAKSSKRDWGIITFFPELEELIHIKEADAAKIELGYGDDYDP